MTFKNYLSTMNKRATTLDNLNRLLHISSRNRAPLGALDALESDTDASSATGSDTFSEKQAENSAVSTSIGARVHRRHVSQAIEQTIQSTCANPDATKAAFLSLTLRVRSRQGNRKAASSLSRNSSHHRSMFADVKLQPIRYLIFDTPEVKNSDFYGFYIFFWLSIGWLLLRKIIHRLLALDKPLISPLVKIFVLQLPRIAAVDAAMYASIYVSYFLQVLVKNGHVEWHSSGWLLQSIYEMGFFVFWLYSITEYEIKNQWIGKVFLVLHMLVLLMKMHSYAFYNGYLWSILRELQFSECALKDLDDDTAGRHFPESIEPATIRKLLEESVSFCRFELLHQSVVLTSGNEEDYAQKSVDELLELSKFPRNISFSNWFAYTMYPTVVYELVFPKTTRIRKMFLFEKLCALVGVIFLMLLIADDPMYQIVMATQKFRGMDVSPIHRVSFFAITLVDLIPPFIMEYLLTFYLIWDTILNAIGELSHFADRDFYGPWWSSTDWSEYSRLWNKPVHRFLLRHVYHSSISALSLTKLQATLMTFFISSLVHELLMYVIFNRLRGYLFAFQMGQLPLVLISQSPVMRNHRVINNVICWLGFTAGPAIICTLYLVF